MKTESKIQSEHTQSLQYMNIRQFFMYLNCIPPIKFHLTHKTSLYHVSFSCKQPAFYRIFQLHCFTPLKKLHVEVNAPDSKFSMEFSHV